MVELGAFPPESKMRKLRLRKKREHQKHDSESGLSEFKRTMLKNPMPLELTSNNYPELGFSSLGSKENFEKDTRTVCQLPT